MNHIRDAAHARPRAPGGAPGRDHHAARELIESRGGTVEKHEPWGRRKLAYEIDHKTDGTYHLLLFASDADTLDELSRILKITDGVMRHLAVRRPEGKTHGRHRERRAGPGPSRPRRHEEERGQWPTSTESCSWAT